MSSKRRKKAYKQHIKETKDIGQVVLDDMLSCSSCGDLGTWKKRKSDAELSVEDIDDLVRQLPGVDYVLERIVNYIFSNGLTTGSAELDESVLDPWLYEQKNRRAVTNFEELRTAIKQSRLYGECGLRLFEGNVYHYKRGYYGMLSRTLDGIHEVVAYFIREDAKYITEDVTLEQLEIYDDPREYFAERGYILLNEDEFINIRNNTSELHGEVPFAKDSQRLDLMLSVYERLNYDIDYDGPGRIIVRPKGAVADDNEVSTGAIIDNSQAAKERRNEKAKMEVKRVAKEIKDSTSDSVILLSNAFDEHIEHLPRVTKATEFFDWITNDTVILAQILGMSPTLLEIGKLHGNVSVEKIIDNAMLNTIIPMRENYAIQFSKPISRLLGVEKIYFDKYDLEQVEDENNIRVKVAQMIRNLSMANAQTPNTNTEQLINEVDEFFRNSLYDAKGDIKTF